MAVILYILKGVNVAVYTGTSLGKSLFFQAILIVKIVAIVFVISPTIALIENQIDDLLILLLSRPVFDDILVLYNAKKRISVIVLIFRNAAMDKNIWKNIEEDVYLVVLVLPKIFFQPTLMFWLSLMRERFNAFCCRLASNISDDAYLMWG